MSSCSRNRSPSDDWTVCEVEQRPARRLDELRRRAQLIARAQQRAHHHAIDVGLRGQRLEVGRLAGEARGDGARSHDQRSDAGQRRRDGVGQAERQEVGLRIGAQDAERQHDEARQRVRQRRRVVAVDAARSRAARSAIASADGGRSAGLLASARRITRSTAATAGEPVSAGGCSCSVACRISTIVRPPKAGRPGEHLEQDGARREEIACARRPARRVTCSGAM